MVLNGLPPLLIHVGDHEILLDDSTGLADHARSAGVDVELWIAPEMIHVWHAFAGIVPESDEALADQIKLCLAGEFWPNIYHFLAGNEVLTRLWIYRPR